MTPEWLVVAVGVFQLLLGLMLGLLYHYLRVDRIRRGLAQSSSEFGGGWQEGYRDGFQAANIVIADAWDEGYHRGVRDNESDLEPADNPYRAMTL